MSGINVIYNGKESKNMAKGELIEAIAAEYKIECTPEVIRALEEAFRMGFLRGEEYGVKCSK